MPVDGAFVRTETRDGVATITLDSPHNRNALSRALLVGLLDAIGAAVDDASVRVIVLDHAGPVFCSGADLRETAELVASGQPPITRVGDVLAAIWDCPKPVVARIAGPARAGGLGLVAAADIAVCADQATFAFTEVRLGVIPAVISATVLPRLAPRAAAELYLTGSTFTGDRAAQIGLVTASVPMKDLENAVAGYVKALVRGAPGALAGAKRLLRRRNADTIGEEVTQLTELSLAYFGSAEGVEGVLAYREKRDPSWVPEGFTD